MKRSVIKRTFDILASSAATGLLSPVLFAVGAAVKLDSPGPVFFKQKRIGKDKKTFSMYKFRTMRTDTPHDMPTHLLKDPGAYITKVGAFLRKTSLDELPQLFNILRGDMSVVGPRPALWNQDDLIADRDRYGANAVRPGLTGWAQVNGRDELEIPVKAAFDGEYLHRQSLLFDLWCIFRTAVNTVFHSGVVEGGTGIHSDTKKKLLLATNHSYMLYRFRKELIETLQDEYDVVVTTPLVGNEAQLEAMGCRLIPTEIDRRSLNPVKDLHLALFYLKTLFAERPDTVLTYSIKPNIYMNLLCRILGVPYYANVQGLGTAFQNKYLALFVSLLYKLALGDARKVFFENEENANLFIENKTIEAYRIKVLHGAGINLQTFRFSDDLPDEPIRFLYLGRIMREKGIDELLNAYQRVKDLYADHVTLEVVGFYEDDYRERLETLAADGTIELTGFTEDPIPCYERASCVVLPSYHEGLSNVLLEAAATGRPLIASDIPGCREAVEPDVSGYLCRAKDADALFEAMRRYCDLSHDERLAMGIAGRRRMEQLFDKTDVVNETLAAMREGCPFRKFDDEIA